jgi:Xaa-Pro aminopeptidase
MLVLSKKRLFRPRQIQIQNLIKYSAIAFCLSTNTAASSFSLATSSTKHVANRVIDPVSTLIANQHPAFLVNRGGSIYSTIKMSSTATSNDVEATATILTVAEKLEKLRSKMEELNIDAYIVPSDDPHLSEYVPEAYMRRSYLSGFGGSAGTAVVFKNEACLWTDSRYHNEAAYQLDADHWTLMKQGLPKVPSLTKYVSDSAVKKFSECEKVFRVGIDPFVHAASFEKEIMDAFKGAVEKSGLSDDAVVGEIDTLDEHGNLVDQVWGDARPAIPTSAFRVHPLEFAGQTVTDKVEEIRDEMENNKATLSVYTALDDIAYLFNVRTKGDIDTSPVGIAYGTITNDEVTLYCDDAKLVSDDVKLHLKESGVTVKPYDAVIDAVKDHLSSTDNAKVWIDKSRSNYALSRLVPDNALVNKQNAVVPMKAIKNNAEMEGMKRAHLSDGVAMAHAISWLENAIVNEGRSVSEVEIDEVVTGERAKQPGYVENSFPTIAGVGSNGAIIHYRAQADSDLLQYLDTSNPILIDSGGQYTYGTTDVTRTWHFGEATADFKENFTRVLKGHIGVDTMIFPTNTPGFVLDVFARKSLWEVGLDYGHGTGHGVGAALNVHEGPFGIAPRFGNQEVMKKGMVVSNEPGVYEDGSYGIRIENLLECTYVLDEDNEAFDAGLIDGDEGFPEKSPGKKTFLRFNKLTMIPIQKNLIDTNLMTTEELEWIDNYHQEVFDKVSPLLEKDTPAYKWLTTCTSSMNTKE